MSFAVILALMTVMAAVAYTRLVRIAQLTSNIETDSLPGLKYSSQILVDRLANYSLTEQYALQTDAVTKPETAGGHSGEPRLHGDTVHTIRRDHQDARRPGLFESFKSAQDLYLSAQDELLAIGLDSKGREEAGQEESTRTSIRHSRRRSRRVTPSLDHNKAAADESTRLITEAVTRAKVAVLVSVGVGLVVAFVCGYFLLRAITRPLGRLVAVLDAMRTGDLSGRLSANATTNSARSRPDSIA